MSRQAPLPPGARIFIGLLCIAGGLMPVLASFDLGPLDRSAINGPPWLGFLAGAIFITGGGALMVGERQRHGLLSWSLTALVIGAFAAIANWIAFGPGPRECAIAVAGLLFASGSSASGIACRAGFGVGAVLLDGFVLWMIAASLRAIVGPGAFPNAIEKTGIALLPLALAPIIVPLLLFPIGKILREGLQPGAPPADGRATRPSSPA
jgi:hypothetical protein